MSREPEPAADSDRFLCLLGIDGSGKSQLLAALQARHPGVVTVHWSQIVSGMRIPTLPPDLTPVQVLQHLGPHGRAAQLCYLAALEYDTVVKPAIARGQVVVVDSYWYKFTAKMRVLGLAAPFLEPACAALPRPRRVLFLETSPETARARRTDPDVFEGKGHPQGFVGFQRTVRAEMLRLVGALPILFLDGHAELGEQLGVVEDACIKDLGLRIG